MSLYLVIISQRLGYFKIMSEYYFYEVICVIVRAKSIALNYILFLIYNRDTV